jgi:hypothetical protein
LPSEETAQNLTEVVTLIEYNFPVVLYADSLSLERSVC